MDEATQFRKGRRAKGRLGPPGGETSIGTLGYKTSSNI
jgi:hypothetical protein